MGIRCCISNLTRAVFLSLHTQQFQSQMPAHLELLKKKKKGGKKAKEISVLKPELAAGFGHCGQNVQA